MNQSNSRSESLRLDRPPVFHKAAESQFCSADRPLAAAAFQSSASLIRRRLQVGIIWLLASAAIVMLAARFANGQGGENYKSLPFEKKYQMTELTGNESVSERRTISDQNRATSNQIKTDQNQVEDILESNGGSTELVNGFFKGYVLPRLTQTDQQTLSTLGQIRDDFLSDYLSDKVVGAAREKFIDQTVVPAMLSIAGDDEFHPATRLNAVCILGRLDKRAVDRGTPPLPSVAAFESVVNILASEQAPDYLKVAAITGIERHLLNNSVSPAQALPQDKIGQATSEALAIINGTAGNQDQWDEALDYWLRKRSVQVLKHLGPAGGNDQVVDALLGLLADQKINNIWLPFEAVVTLGKMNLSSVSPAKAAEVPSAITRFLSRAFESKSIELQAALDAFVFRNLLLEDLDLEIKPVEYIDNALSRFPKKITRTVKAEPERGRRDDMGMDDMMMDDMMMDDMGMDDMMMEDMPGMGGGGMMGMGGARAMGARLNLPTYRLNQFRNNLKVLAYEGKRALSDGSAGVKAYATENDKKLIDSVIDQLNVVIQDSNIGIEDLSNPDENLEPEEASNTEKMIELSSDTASRLANLAQERDPAAAQPADDGGTSAVGGDSATAVTADGVPDFN